jgi:DNA-directed RNA polymerase specialized sigma24 family protein
MCEPVDQASRGKTLLESHFGLIQQRLQALSRHSGLPDHQTDEFLSWALFKLVENDYRILAGWEGRSSFSTYLTVVLVNLMRDYRMHVWGRQKELARIAVRLRAVLIPLLRKLPAESRFLLKLSRSMGDLSPGEERV